MKELKIGSLLIGKKAYLGVILVFFLTGMVWSTFLFDKDHDLIPVMIVITALIWAFIIPKIRKHVKYDKK